MKSLSLEPFVPSGSNFEGSKQFFQELSFHINWEVPNYVGFQRDECRFVLQLFDNVEFAQNFMLSVQVDSAEEFRNSVLIINCLKNMASAWARSPRNRMARK